MEQNINENTGKPINRAELIDNVINKVEEKNDQILTVLLEDIDGAINYYFNSVMKPRVEENGMFITVPVMYGSPERWKSIQVDGFVRDNKGRLITPLIMFKRNSVAQNPDISVDKLDANNPNIFYTVQRKYSQKNRYDNFNILTDQIPIREYYNVVMPDYITATYDVVLWTSYVAQMNKLVEALIYSSGAYWGDVSKFRFRTVASDIATPVEITNDTDRTSKSTLTLTVYGYLVPDNISKILAQKGEVLKKTLSVKKTIVFVEVDNYPHNKLKTQ